MSSLAAKLVNPSTRVKTFWSFSIVVLNIDKAHGHDGLSIRMPQMWSDSISKPFSVISWKCLKAGYFPVAWKKGNVFTVHKKGNKPILNNFRTVSLFLICSKFFEKIILTQFFNTWWKTICLIQISQALCLAILVSINLFPLPMKYLPLSIPISH